MLLALDTSTTQVGLAIYDGTRIIGEVFWHGRKHHTVDVPPALADLFKRTGVMINDIQALGVALGPGSFTSLRAGLALAKGLALARRCPLIGINTFDILAAAMPVSDRRLATILQAGRGRLAIGWYTSAGEEWQTEGPAGVTTIDKLVNNIRRPTLVCGELTAGERQRLARKYKNVILASPAQSVRRPGILAELAWQKWQTGRFEPAASLSPIYLHVAGAPRA